MTRILLLLVIACTSTVLFAQPGSVPVVDVNGKKFHEHTVEAGQTLWGIQQLYGVPSAEIIASNAGSAEGLKAGQKILIPIKEIKKEQVLVTYTVQKGETLYGISKRFDTTPEKLMEWNPEVINGLKGGQEIKVPALEGGQIDEQATTTTEVVQEQRVEEIPNPFVSDTTKLEVVSEKAIELNDSVHVYTVRPQETLYSIAKRFMVSVDELKRVNNLSSTSLKEGQQLVIPLKQENLSAEIKAVPGKTENQVINQVPVVKKSRYKVAVLLPLYLDYGQGYSEFVVHSATQFYMGMELALDSLRRLGLKADVEVFDSKNDPEAVKKLLQNPKMSEVDMIIGPFFESSQVLVAEFCLQHKIRMVCPVAVAAAILKNNPYVYSAVPTNMTLMKGLAGHISSRHRGANILLVKPKKESDQPLYQAFLSAYSGQNQQTPYKEINYAEIGTYLKKGSTNVFIVPTEDKSSAMTFMNSLSDQAFKSKDSIIVYGTKEWVNFTDISNVYKNKYNFHYPAPNFLDYNKPDLIRVNRTFRSKYNTDMSRMAVQGFDVMLGFATRFLLEKEKPSLLMNTFKLDQVGSGHGFENTYTFIIEQEEYELIDVSR